MEFIATDRRRAEPGIAIDVDAAAEDGASSADTGRIGFQMRGVLKLRIGGEIVRSGIGQRIDAAKVQGASVEIGAAYGSVINEDRVVERTAGRPTARDDRRVSCQS